MAKNIGFRDFLNVDYAPGMPDLIKRNAKKRKSNETETSGPNEAAVPPGGKPLPALTPDQAHKWLDQGKHAKKLDMGRSTKNVVVKQELDTKGKQHQVKVHQYTEEVDLDEALSPQQRRRRALQMNRMKAKIQLGRKRAARRFADPKRLKQRALRAARKVVFNALAKQVPKDELTYQRRQEIEKRMENPRMKQRIERLAVKLLKKERDLEMQRHTSKGPAQ